MCGYSDAQVNGLSLDFYLGAHGAYFRIDLKDETLYYGDTVEGGGQGRDEERRNRKEMTTILNDNLTREQLVEVILQFVDHGTEG